MPVVGDGNKLSTAQIPAVPTRYRSCARLAKLTVPAGGWTSAKAINALATLRASEIEKSECLLDFNEWAQGTLNGIRGSAAR